MEKFFNPQSIVIFGLSAKKDSIPGYILQNTIRWGFKGRIFGVMPGAAGESVQGVTVYGSIKELPVVPDLAVMLIPAKYVPMAMEECGKFGIRRAAVLAGGFNESGESGEELADSVKSIAQKYDMRFIGPNGLSVADTYSGICLPFLPHVRMPKGGFSLISQSGGLFFVLWNLMNDENLGMAKFASIGNKLNVDEADMLEYFGNDPQTKVIGLYLESISNGERLVEVARKIKKPIIALKANVSQAGSRAAMSHTASMSNNDDIVEAAFERAGIIRIEHVHDFVSAAKIFNLPPMRGNRLMVMTPGGGSAVMMADLCEKYGFEFADPGPGFYEKLNEYTNAGGIIKFSNPLDMGDIYNIHVYPKIFHDVLNNENVDGAIYGHARPQFPKKEDSIFKKMFYADISKETIGAMLTSGKPLGITMSAPMAAQVKIKKSIDYPIYDRAEEVIRAMRIQADFYARRDEEENSDVLPENINFHEVWKWMNGREGNRGEEMLDALGHVGINGPVSCVAEDEEAAVAGAAGVGYPVVMKVVSPDVLHKSDAGGVITGIENDEEAARAYREIIENIEKHNKHAVVEGVRIAGMAGEGHDMFVGAVRDKSFGPVVVFGYGGIYTEVFRDIDRVLCPASNSEIEDKLKNLKCYEILKGARGRGKADIDAFVDIIRRVSLLMTEFPEIKELDLNPVRVFVDGKGAMALDARARIEKDNDDYCSTDDSAIEECEAAVC